MDVFQDAVCTLNTLQTNASALEQVKRERGHPQLQLQAMRGFLQRAGLKVSNLSYTTLTLLMIGADGMTKILPLLVSVLANNDSSLTD